MCGRRSVSAACHGARWAGLVTVFLLSYTHPKDNLDCAQVVTRYRECLSDTITFNDWTLEKFTDIIKKYTASAWIDDFTDRYLNFSKLDNV